VCKKSSTSHDVLYFENKKVATQVRGDLELKVSEYYVLNVFYGFNFSMIIGVM